MGDPLIALNAHVDWEAFRADLNRVHLGVGLLGGERKSNAGAKPIDVVLKFKILVLQQLHNLSDPGFGIRSDHRRDCVAAEARES